MKTITKWAISGLLILTSMAVRAQLIQTIPVSSPGACDGKAYLSPNTGITNWSWSDVNNNLIQNGGDSLTGLCVGTYIFNYPDSSGLSVSYQFYIDSANISPCNSLGIEFLNVIQPTGPNSCDGSAEASAYGGTSPYTYTWNNGTSGNINIYLCGGYYTVNVTDANGCMASSTINIVPDSSFCNNFILTVSNTNESVFGACDATATGVVTGGMAPNIYWDNGQSGTTATGLCAGYHSVTAWDSLSGCMATQTFYVLEDSTNIIWNGLYAWTNTSDVSADGLCDGTVDIVVNGGTAPYTYMHDNGATTSSLSGLCAGYYGVLVMDANGDSTYVYYLIGTPGNTINNTNPDSTYLDTLSTGLITNCVLSYFSIDSAYISGSNFIGLDTVAVYWTIVDANGSYTITSYYTFSDGFGLYTVVLELFCPQRGTGEFLTVKDQILIDPSVMGIKKKQQIDAAVYPNPFADQLNIRLKEYSHATATLTDLSGKVLNHIEINGQQQQINTSDLSAGHYLLIIETTEGKSIHKIIK